MLSLLDYEKSVMSAHNVLFDYAVSMKIIDILYQVNQRYAERYAPDVLHNVNTNRTNGLKRFENFLYNKCVHDMCITANEFWGWSNRKQEPKLLILHQRYLPKLKLAKSDEAEILKKLSDLELFIGMYDDSHWANLNVARNCIGHHILMSEPKQNSDLKAFFKNDPRPDAVKFEWRMEQLLQTSFELVNLIQGKMKWQKFDHALSEVQIEALGFVDFYDVEMTKLLDKESQEPYDGRWEPVLPLLS